MKNKTKPLRGHALLKAAWNYIAKHPDKWNQHRPFPDANGCGCLGVHASKIGRIKDGWTAVEQHCDITPIDAGYLFRSSRTLRELRARVVKIVGAKGVLKCPKGY